MNIIIPSLLLTFFSTKQIWILSWKQNCCYQKKKKKRKEGRKEWKYEYIAKTCHGKKPGVRWGGMDSGNSRSQYHTLSCQSHNQSLMNSLALRNQTGLITASLGQNKITVYTSYAFWFGYPEPLLLVEALSQGFFFSFGVWEALHTKVKMGVKGGRALVHVPGTNALFVSGLECCCLMLYGNLLATVQAGLCWTLFPSVCYLTALTWLRHRKCLFQWIIVSRELLGYQQAQARLLRFEQSKLIALLIMITVPSIYVPNTSNTLCHLIPTIIQRWSWYLLLCFTGKETETQKA